MVIISVPLSPVLTLSRNCRLRSHVIVRSVGSEDSVKVSSRESVMISGASAVIRKGKKSREDVNEELKPMWDDGYGTQTMRDCAKTMEMGLSKSDGGPPRWFCPVACGKPLNGSPVLLYLPGVDGTGTGLAVHEKALGKVFRVQCLHIPTWDRTPLEGLIQIVEETLMIEHGLSPKKPIYLLGDSFGGALALSVAARNPTLDLILILANPATSYEMSLVHPLVAIGKALPEQFHVLVPYAISPLLGNYVKLVKDGTYDESLLEFLWQAPGNLCKDVPLLSMMTKLLPKDTLYWRLELIESAAAYANSRLHAITAQVLVLASGKDNLMPSKKEAERLSGLLKHCKVRMYEDNGHTILLESGVNVLSAIKTNQMYRRSSKFDIVKDFLQPNLTEVKTTPIETWWYRITMAAVLLSTMEDGSMVRGLAGIPDEGPVLLVGNHMLMGLDVFSLCSEYLREKKHLLFGLAHPEMFTDDLEDEQWLLPVIELVKLGGGIPVSGRNFFRLLEKKSHILLYPGGILEALHRKGEGGKLLWPDKQDFVKMAVKFGATIVPYGGVGEDDMLEIIFDYDELERVPLFRWMMNNTNRAKRNLSKEMSGGIADQPLHFPFLLPKYPGRLYYKFGKPIRTKGNEHKVNDNEYLQELYMQIKSDVKKNMAYLLEKRKEDPYRCLIKRQLWLATHGSVDHIPTFEP